MISLNFVQRKKPFFLVAAASLGWAWLNTALPVSAATTTVSIGDNFFNPSSSTINVNDSVQWTWDGTASHSSTSDTGLWDSTILGHGSTFSHSFTSAGSFAYHCNVHAGQTGSITVQSAANSPPSVTITNPVTGSIFTAPATVTIMARASDSDGSVTNVQFRIGTSVLTNRPTLPYSVTVANLVASNYTFSAVASDNKGMKATNSISLIVNAPPSVTITNPADGSVFSAPATFTIMASASDSDGSVTNVQILQGTSVLTNRTSTPYSAVVNNLAAGNYAFSAVASDNRGARSTNSINLIVNGGNALPTVNITAPTNGTVLAAPWSGTIQAVASDSDGSVTNVVFFSDVTPLGSVANPPTNFTFGVTNLGAGSHTLTAQATDNRGGTNTSSGITVNVVTPAAITMGAIQRPTSTSFQFSYSANVGLTYIVERSVNLSNWIAINTNTAVSTPVVFLDSTASASPAFYRVQLQRNP